MASNNDEMISLNLEEKQNRQYFSKYDLHCPNCDSTNYRVAFVPENTEDELFNEFIEHNICETCKTRFTDQGDIISNPKVKAILGVFGIFIVIFALVAIFSLVSQWLS